MRGTAMRIATAFVEPTANVHYRVLTPAMELARRGHVVMTPRHATLERLDRHPPPWDLLHMHQLISDDALALVQRLRRHGIAVVWDTDDDIAAAPRSSNAYRRMGGRRKVKRYFRRTVEMARAAHLMTTTNEHLADVYRDAGVAHVAVIGNYVRAVSASRRARRIGVTIGCAAASEHKGDLEGLGIARALASILARHEAVRVVAVGLDLGLDDVRYTHYRHVPLERLIELERGWDIGIAPLIDSRLNRSRSDVKLKEYASAGAAWLASPVGPYVGMGEEQGGLLVPPGGWYEALDRLVGDRELRRRLADNACRWVRTQTIERAGRSWEQAFREAISRARAERDGDAATATRWGLAR